MQKSKTPPKDCSRDDDKQSDADGPVLELSGTWRIPSSPTDQLWTGVLVLIRVSTMGQIERFNYILYLKPLNLNYYIAILEII